MKFMALSRFRFSDLSIKGKVMLVTCVASLVALFAVAGGLYAFQLRHFRQTFQRELRTLAQIMADNCATAVAFHDPKTAQEVLAPLEVKPEIEHAAVLGKDGASFAVFGGADESPPPKPGDPAGLVDRGAAWTVVQPIVLDGERIGTFFMDVNYARPLGELQRVYLGVTAAVLGGSLVLVVLLTMRLQDFIARPIRLLAEASGAVARDRDYSVRVDAAGADELGQLTAAFNHMLARIQEQDGALHTARGELQGKVAALEHEIEERKAAEEALSLSQQKLVETSRLAGMAEVATGVLHNVGNVLNSVNISASLALEKLRNSKVESFTKASALLGQHAQDLGDYITTDPQGQRLPGFLQKLAGVLVEENAALRTELDHLGRNVEHIKEIVAMQQSYARVTGVLEDLPAERLIEDALQLNAESFTRHRIEIVRDFQPAPPVRVDKHKVLQILINLLRNAKHAVEDAQRSDPRIAIAIVPDGAGSRISITDNGVGIAPENLTSVFRHGFTTKKNGHGFGLHSGANAAKEMGGALSVASAGPGRGATFTLELPAAAPAENSKSQVPA